MEYNKRLGISILLGAMLGVLCIIGISMRIGSSGNEWFLFAMWYNRLLMGVLIGFAGSWTILPGEGKELKNASIRGLVLGAIVTSAILFSTGIKDIPSWFAGIVYGPIIDIVATHFAGE